MLSITCNLVKLTSPLTNFEYYSRTYFLVHLALLVYLQILHHSLPLATWYSFLLLYDTDQSDSSIIHITFEDDNNINHLYSALSIIANTEYLFFFLVKIYIGMHIQIKLDQM